MSIAGSRKSITPAAPCAGRARGWATGNGTSETAPTTMGIFSKSKKPSPSPSPTPRGAFDSPAFRALLKQSGHRLALRRATALATVASSRAAAAAALQSTPPDLARAAARVAPALSAARHVAALDAAGAAAAALAAAPKPLALASSLFELAPEVQRQLATVLAAADRPPLTPECAKAAAMVAGHFSERQVTSFRAAVAPERSVNDRRRVAEPTEGEMWVALEEVSRDYGTPMPEMRPQAVKEVYEDECVPSAPAAPMAPRVSAVGRGRLGVLPEEEDEFSPPARAGRSSPFQLPRSAEPTYPKLSVDSPEAPMPPPVTLRRSGRSAPPAYVPDGASVKPVSSELVDRARANGSGYQADVNVNGTIFQRKISRDVLESSRAVRQQRGPVEHRNSPRQFVPFSASQSSPSSSMRDEELGDMMSSESSSSESESTKPDHADFESSDGSEESEGDGRRDAHALMPVPEEVRRNAGGYGGRKRVLGAREKMSFSTSSGSGTSDSAGRQNRARSRSRSSRERSLEKAPERQTFEDNDAMLLVRYRELMSH